MTVYKTNLFLERLDKIARWTKIPTFWEGNVRHRRMKFLPAVLIVMSSLGMVGTLLFPEKFILWDGLMLPSLFIGGVVSILGPLKANYEGADEREKNLRRDAYLVTFAAISFVAVFGMGLLIILTAIHEGALGPLLKAMIVLIIYLVSLFQTIPTLYASWTMPESMKGGG